MLRLVRQGASLGAVAAAAATATASATLVASTAPARRSHRSSPQTLLEQAKQQAAFRAVDENVKSGDRVGVGSGSTVVYAVERLAEHQQARRLKNILIVEHGLTLSNLSITPELDIAIDGADETDDALNAIKGGGGCHLQEKVVASSAKRFVIIADYRKNSHTLGEAWKKGVPVEVAPFAYVPVTKKLAAIGGTATLRMGSGKAGPVVTDNGNFILDVDFGEVTDPATTDAAIRAVPGVVETGLFVSMAERAYFGQADGSVDMVLPTH